MSLPTCLLSALLLAVFLSVEARPDPRLSTRLQADSTIQCWQSLMELRSCSGEVILFFLNGETYLGPSCCHSIRIIKHRCWAADAMLAALGFTAQEGDILKGYCDAASSSNGSSAPPPPPASGSSAPPPSPASGSSAPPPPPASLGPASDVKPVHRGSVRS